MSKRQFNVRITPSTLTQFGGEVRRLSRIDKRLRRDPLAEVAAVTARHGRALLVDSMSAFGALPVDAREIPFQALAASLKNLARSCAALADSSITITTSC